MIFVDASVPRSVADRIKGVRPDARWLADLFPLNTEDTDWLQRAGKEGWLVITHDKKIKTRPGERRAIIEHGVGCFILAYRQNLKKPEIEEMVLGALEDMEDLFGKTARPFIYTVTKNGEFNRYKGPL